MLGHIVPSSWNPAATEEQKRQATTGLAKLPSVRACRGPDAGLAEGDFDFAVSAEFGDEADFFAYRDGPRHREIIRRYFLPTTAQCVAVQFQFWRPRGRANHQDCVISVAGPAPTCPS
jgi:hypothetical protein